MTWLADLVIAACCGFVGGWAYVALDDRRRLRRARQVEALRRAWEQENGEK